MPTSTPRPSQSTRAESKEAQPAGVESALAANIRRLMAREGLTFDDVIAATELDERTIRSILRGGNRPHARTLHKLASGLGVEVDELFVPPAELAARKFDRVCNPVVDQLVGQHPGVFAGWREDDFDELSSRFGTGGELSETGALAAAQAMNDKRAVLHQVAVILETHEASLLSSLVETIFERISVQDDSDTVRDKQDS